MSEIKITKDNFEKEVLNSAVPTVIDFWAPWCAPCRMLAPVITELAEEYGDKIKVGKINVDEEAELAMKYKVASIPMVVLFRNGEISAKSIGLVSKQELVTALGI